MKRAVSAAAFARDWRNRLIAHLDRNLALNEDAKALEPASREIVSVALSAIHRVLNHVSEDRLKCTPVAEVECADGAPALLHILRAGLDAEDARMKRIRAGRPEPGDLEKRVI